MYQDHLASMLCSFVSSAREPCLGFCIKSNILISDMADDVLFAFLHLEMVSHIYRDQASRGEMDKVTLG